jgi:hypothetical protein
MEDVMLTLPDRDVEGEVDGVSDDDTLLDCDGDGEDDNETDCDQLALAVTLADKDTDADALLDSERLLESLVLGDVDGDTLTEGEGVGLANANNCKESEATYSVCVSPSTTDDRTAPPVSNDHSSTPVLAFHAYTRRSKQPQNTISFADNTAADTKPSRAAVLLHTTLPVQPSKA